MEMIGKSGITPALLTAYSSSATISPSVKLEYGLFFGDFSGPIRKYGGIRAATHPRSLRCSWVKYHGVFAPLAPCERGTSPPSVLHHIYEQGHQDHKSDPPGCQE